MEQDNLAGISGLSLISIIVIVCLIFIAIAIFIERNILPNQKNRLLIRIIIFAFMINIAILIFLIMSFGKLKFSPGPAGPRGIRGRPGRTGRPNALNGCAAVPVKLGQERIRNRKVESELILEKPILKKTNP